MKRYSAYKESGISWLNRVPENWGTIRLKNIVTFKNGFAFSSSDYFDSGIQLIQIGSLYQNKLCLERNPVFLSEDKRRSHSNFIVSKNDILISLTGTLGKKDYGFSIKLHDEREFFLNQRVGCLKPVSYTHLTLPTKA